MYKNLDFAEPFKNRQPFDLHSSVFKVEGVREKQETEEAIIDLRKRFKFIKMSISQHEKMDSNCPNEESDSLLAVQSKADTIEKMYDYHCMFI